MIVLLVFIRNNVLPGKFWSYHVILTGLSQFIRLRLSS